MKPPVTYQGGKVRLASQILDCISYAGREFWDVCCGSGAVTLALLERGHPADQITMVESGPWGAFWKAISDGTFCIERFQEFVSDVPTNLPLVQGWAKETAAQTTPNEDVPYVFILLQAASFGGKAVDRVGGEWRHSGFRNYWTPTATSNRRSVVNPMMPLPATVLERVQTLVAYQPLQDTTVLHCDATTTRPQNAAVYVDPPYTNHQTYNTQTLDVRAFAQRCTRNGCDVWVSEAEPLTDSFVCLSKGRSKGGISGSRRRANAEYLSHYNDPRPGRVLEAL